MLLLILIPILHVLMLIPMLLLTAILIYLLMIMLKIATPMIIIVLIMLIYAAMEVLTFESVGEIPRKPLRGTFSWYEPCL